MTVTARVSSGSSRYAMPTIPELVYAALLYKDGDSPANPPSKDFVQGTKAADSDKLIFSFQRPENTSGNFTLEVFAFVKANLVVAEDGTPTFFRAGALLSGSKDKLPIEGDEIKVTDPIALSSDEPGTVSLKVTVPEDCSLTIDDTAKTNFTCEKEGGSSDTYALTATGIPAGAYSVDFTVKKDEVVVHIFTESINVLPGLCTDTWGGLAKGAAKDVTHSMSKTLYVRGSGGWYDSTAPYSEGETAKADDTNLGSFSSPLATIQKAIDKIIAINDGSNYTIYIDGTLKYDESTYVGTNGMADFSAPTTQDLNLTIKALSGTATLDGGARFDANGNITAEGIGKSVIYAAPASGTLNLTLDNLVITGGNTSKGGGGIYIGSGKFEMTGGKILKNISSRSGGGVYISKGTFDMEGGTISENTANKNGGGVYVATGTFSMKGGTISGNNAENGCGVYVDSGTFTMEGGTISDNNAPSYGGGVFVVNGTFTFTGGTISKCTARRGGGVSVYKGIFTMLGGTIGGETAGDANTASWGGGVYVEEDATFTMTGGTIGGNSASGNGGGIYVAATSSAIGTFNMSGSAKVESDNDVYLYASGSNVATITIADDLTASAPVATITPSAYTAGRQVLSADNETIMQNNCGKFALSEEEWEIIPNDTAGILGISIYLNSSIGDDANSGLTASKAVKTLSKAIELFESQGAQKIMVCAKYALPSEESTLLNRAGKSKLTFMRYTGKSDVSERFLGTFFSISRGDVTISNLTLDGKINGYNTDPLLHISGSSATTVVTLENDTVICNNSGSGVIIVTGKLKMTGGEITRSKGGVSITQGTFEMSDGIISHNSGGGVRVEGVGGTFTMTGGEITSNYASIGGGVSVSSSYAKFEMSGGTISGNQSYGTGDGKGGGGVYVNGKFTMSGGEITGNTATNNGGGVYQTSSGTFTSTNSDAVHDNTPDDVYNEPSS